MNTGGAVRNITSEDAAGSEEDVVTNAQVTDTASCVAINAVVDSAVEHAGIVVKSIVGCALRADVRS